MQLKEILTFYTLPREKEWASRLWHLAERVERERVQLKTDFLDPHLQRLATDVLVHFSRQLNYALYGGFPQAERARLFLWPADWPARPEMDAFSYIQVRGNFSQEGLRHGDFLGSLLGLGVERGKVGDILYDGLSTCQVVLDDKLASFMLSNWVKVGSVAVVAEEISEDLLKLPRERYKTIKGTVASPRLDAVAGLGFGLSRSKTTPLIKGEQVKLNWQVAKSPAQHVQEGDVISIAGKGRVIVESFAGTSKKERRHIILKKIL